MIKKAIYLQIDQTTTNWKLTKNSANVKCFKKKENSMRTMKLHVKMKASVKQLIEVLHFNPAQYYKRSKAFKSLEIQFYNF